MEQEASATGRFFCYILDKIFHSIMVLLYGAHPSETRGQKLNRWGVVLFAIIGVVVFFIVIKSLFSKPSAPRRMYRAPTIPGPPTRPRPPTMPRPPRR